MLRINVKSVIEWDRPMIVYHLHMTIMLQPTTRKRPKGGFFSEGKVQLSSIEWLGTKTSKHEGSYRKAKEMLSMSTLEPWTFVNMVTSGKVRLAKTYDFIVRNNCWSFDRISFSEWDIDWRIIQFIFMGKITWTIERCMTWCHQSYMVYASWCTPIF